MNELTQVRGGGSMPEEEPLEHLAVLLFAFKTENALFVYRVNEVEELCRGLMNSERWVLMVIDENRNTAIWIQPQIPCECIRSDIPELRCAILR